MNFNKKIIDSNNVTLDKLNKKIELIQQAETNNNEKEFGKLSLEYAVLAEELVSKARDLAIYTGEEKSIQVIQTAIKANSPVDIYFTEEGWLVISIPALLPKRNKGNPQYIREIVQDALKTFFDGRDYKKIEKCIFIYEHIYDEHRPKRQWRDHDNIEVNTVSDMIALFFLRDDSASICSHFYCSKAGEQNRTNVYVIPDTDFVKWCEQKEIFNDTSE